MAGSATRFAQLLREGIAAIAARTGQPKGVIHDELGYALGRVGGSAIAYWSYGDGHLPRHQADVEKLARELVRRGHLDRDWLADFLTSAGYPDTAQLVAELFAQTAPLLTALSVSYAPLAVPTPQSLPPFLVEAAHTLPEETVFVARRHELAALHGFLARMLAGQGQVVFVNGEAGSGKTTLLHEFARQAQADESTLIVARGAGSAYTGIGDPYLPFREIMTMLSGDVESLWQAGAIPREQALRLWRFLPHTVHALLDYGPNLLDTFVPGQALLHRALLHPTPRADWKKRLRTQLTHNHRTAPDQNRIFEEYAQVLDVLSATCPLLLLLDDLHWADVSSLSLLFYLGRRLGERRILLVASYRPEDVALDRRGEPHPLAEIVAELQRQTGDTWVNLDSPRAAGRDFIDELLDTEPNHLNEAFRQALFRQSGGHALFTVELLRDLQERGDLVKDASGHWRAFPHLDWHTLPARIEGVIAKRLGRLDPDLRDILTVASIEGEEFTAEVVARVQGLDARSVVQWLGGKLARQHRLVRAQGLRPLGAQRLCLYQFRHQLFQAYLYQQLDAAERAHLHGAVGTALEELFHNQEEELALKAAQLAHHFQEAGLVDKAIEYRLLAGQRAVRVSANLEAIRHFEAGLALLQTLPDTPDRARRELALQLALGVPVTAAKGYAHPAVEPIYARARALCEQLGDTVQLFPALYGLWRMLLIRGQLQDSQALAHELMALAQRAKDPDLYLEAYRALGCSASHLGELITARAQFEDGLALYDRRRHAAHVFLYGHDPAVSCLGYLALTLWLLGYPDQARDKCREVLHLARELSHPFSLGHALIIGATTFHQLQGEVREVQELAETSIALAAEHGFPYWESMGATLLGWASAQQGEPERGIADMRQGLVDWEATGARIQIPYCLTLLAEIHGRVGQVELGLSVLAEAMAVLAQTGERWYESELYRLGGELRWMAGAPASEAENLFQHALAIARQQQARSLELRAAMSLSRFWQKQGRCSEAHDLLAPVYGWFTEGFDTPDLQQARSLLDALS